MLHKTGNIVWRPWLLIVGQPYDRSHGTLAITWHVGREALVWGSPQREGNFHARNKASWLPEQRQGPTCVSHSTRIVRALWHRSHMYHIAITWHVSIEALMWGLTPKKKQKKKGGCRPSTRPLGGQSEGRGPLTRCNP